MKTLAYVQKKKREKKKIINNLELRLTFNFLNVMPVFRKYKSNCFILIKKKYVLIVMYTYNVTANVLLINPHPNKPYNHVPCESVKFIINKMKSLKTLIYTINHMEQQFVKS